MQLQMWANSASWLTTWSHPEHSPSCESFIQILLLLTNCLYVCLSLLKNNPWNWFQSFCYMPPLYPRNWSNWSSETYISELSGSTFSAILLSWHACQNKSSCFSPNFVSCWCCPSRVHDGPGCPKQMKLNEIPMIQCLCIRIGYRTKAKGLSLGQPGFSKGMLTMHNVRFKALATFFLNSTAFFWGSSTQIYVLLTRDKD